MKPSYPWISLVLGLVLILVLLWMGAMGPRGQYGLPLLTLLLMSEFGFLLAGFAVVAGIGELLRRGIHGPTALLLTANLILALGFAWIAFALWPGNIASAQ